MQQYVEFQKQWFHTSIIRGDWGSNPKKLLQNESTRYTLHRTPSDFTLWGSNRVRRSLVSETISSLSRELPSLPPQCAILVVLWCDITDTSPTLKRSAMEQSPLSGHPTPFPTTAKGYPLLRRWQANRSPLLDTEQYLSLNNKSKE